jgi:hypothetical protein
VPCSAAGVRVLLDVFGEVASKKLGWAVLHVQALQEESLVAVLLQRIPEAVRPWERFGPGSKDLQAHLKTSAVSAGAAVERGHNAATGSAAAAFEDAVGRVGSFAAGHGTGLLITVDEAQMAPQEDVSALARALQTVVARRLQPVAVVFSGLETFRDRLAGAGTYASRLPVEKLGNLEPSAARLALVEPAARRHVAWEAEALGLLVRRSGGHPYYVQLFGWHAWEAAQGETTITLAHAKAGLRSARAELAGQYEATWGRLRPQERDYLAAVASLAGAGGAGVDEVAKVLGKEPKQLAVARDRLVHKHGLLEVPERAQVRFVDAEMAAWVAERPDGIPSTTAVQRALRPRQARAVVGPALALSGRRAVPEPPAGHRAAPALRALTPPALRPGLCGPFGPGTPPRHARRDGPGHLGSGTEAVSTTALARLWFPLPSARVRRAWRGIGRLARGRAARAGQAH